MSWMDSVEVKASIIISYDEPKDSWDRFYGETWWNFGVENAQYGFF